MRDYSEQADDYLGTVRLLEDTDGDGRFDRATLFADNLSWPTAIACYDGGVFIGAAPDILYCKDTDGDGRADHREVVYRGFGRSNVQGLLNSFTWGLDNRIHGATSSAGAKVVRVDDESAEPLVLSGRDFAFDPRTREIVATSGGAQHGMSFNRWGRRFLCSNSDHIQLVMFEDRYVARNPYMEVPSARRSIAADGPQAEVFRISPVEPWRIVRTRLRASGVVPGVVEGGGRPAGYFTGATGVTIYRGDAWPEEYLDQAFIGDVGSNIVHRKVLRPNGVELIAQRVDDGFEFVASSDIWFRPCQFYNAPDGGLYILDVYREVIEHPASLPPMIKKHLDLTSGRDRGRIYRIVPADYQQRPQPRLSSATTEELVATLAHANGWHRETASRLLWERQDRTAVAPLIRLAFEAERPEGRMHALYALDGLGALSVEVILRALDDEHPRVREHAVRLSEKLAADAPAIQAKLFALVDDDDQLVRYQLAFTLGEISGTGRNAALARLARRDAGDRWMRLAMQSSLSEGADAVFGELVRDASFRATDPGRTFLASLAEQLGTRNQPDGVALVMKEVEALPPDDVDLGQTIVKGLSEGLGRSGVPQADRLASAGSSRLAEMLDDLLQRARTTVLDEGQPLEKRVEAIRSLGLGTYADARDVLSELLDNRQPQALQVAALAALARFPEVEVAELILDSWPGFSPRLRVEATEVLFARPARLHALLAALESGEIAAADLDPGRVRTLLSHPDPSIAEPAERLLGDVTIGRRQDVVDAYRDVLDMAGDPTRGEAAFRKVCAACHRIGDVGHEIGPNLATLQNRGAESILLNILDPNREVNPQYVNYVLLTTDGRSVTGMIAAESATSVTLRRAEGAEDTVLRVNIDQLQSTSLSIMPEGLEQQLDKQAMADLIAYLTSLE